MAVETLTEQVSATAVVVEFLDAMVAGDFDRARELVTDDLEYVNVGLPAIRGIDAFTRAMRGFERRGLFFEYDMINVAADGPVVLTERIDRLGRGRLVGEFWVCGTFEVRDGRVAVWRDRFDFVDVTRGFARGALRAVLGRS